MSHIDHQELECGIRKFKIVSHALSRLKGIQCALLWICIWCKSHWMLHLAWRYNYIVMSRSHNTTYNNRVFFKCNYRQWYAMIQWHKVRFGTVDSLASITLPSILYTQLVYEKLARNCFWVYKIIVYLYS